MAGYERAERGRNRYNPREYNPQELREFERMQPRKQVITDFDTPSNIDDLPGTYVRFVLVCPASEFTGLIFLVLFFPFTQSNPAFHAFFAVELQKADSVGCNHIYIFTHSFSGFPSSRFIYVLQQPHFLPS